MNLKKTIKRVLIVLVVTLLYFASLLFLIFHRANQPHNDPYANLHDSQDLPSRAIDGTWLASLTSHTPSLAGGEWTSTQNFFARVKVLEERHDTHPHIRHEYYYDHIFSIYRAEVLEIYDIRSDLWVYPPEVGEIMEFAQIKRIVGRERERWFEFLGPPTNLFPPVRVPVFEGDKLILRLSGLNRPQFLNPVSGAYRYSPEQSTQGNRVFESLNKHCGLVLTEMELARISEMFTTEN
jgi:hypothetical protein